MIEFRIFSWSYSMFVYNEKLFAVIWLCCSFWRNQIENNPFYLVAIRPYSQSQRLFVDISFKFLNNRCRCTAYGNFAMPLSLMQRCAGYLLTIQYFDF